MSRQRSLEQRRATAAWEAVKAVAGKEYAKDYGQLAKSAPADIQANGLGQTLAFWRSKKDKEEHEALFTAVSNWIKAQLRLEPGSDLLTWIVTKASTNEYRRATAEAIAFLNWLKRFAEAELGE